MNEKHDIAYYVLLTLSVYSLDGLYGRFIHTYNTEKAAKQMKTKLINAGAYTDVVILQVYIRKGE